MSMDAEPRQLVDAALALAQTAHRLRAMRQAALAGAGFDPDAFDAAVVAYRRARSRAAYLRDPAGERWPLLQAEAA